MKNNKTLLQQRDCDPVLLAESTQLHPLLQRIFSARKIPSFDAINYKLTALTPLQSITNLDDASELLAGHIQRHSSILIFGDYDADGATSTALCVRALNLLGHSQVIFLLPDRIVDGYGVSQNAAQQIIAFKPDLVITVDTGIASFNGLEKIMQAGIEVIVTDHHLPADRLPRASVIVNPNAFENSAGKNLAGVGVAFYLMLAVRSRLRDTNWFDSHAEPNLADCLDLVAIGTVADLVPLDYNNRILVSEGLKRLRAGACSTGIRKLIEISGRSRFNLTSQDIAFAVAPRINAAGRLDDMTIGVQTLLAEDENSASNLARELDNINRYRRELQGQMTEQAMQMLPDVEHTIDQYSVVLYQPEWHEGIVGIIASKIKDITFRPAISFAPSGDGFLKGSGRSIRGIHLRDMLDLVDKSTPGLIQRFGGHAMAAGLTIAKDQLQQFTEKFEQILQKHADPACLNNVVEHDGQIDSQEMNMQLAVLLRQSGPWGQHFPVPSFTGEFKVVNQRVLVDKHLKFVLTSANKNQPVDAILFFASEQQLKTNYQSIKLHYELGINEYQGVESLQLMIRHIL